MHVRVCSDDGQGAASNVALYERLLEVCRPFYGLDYNKSGSGALHLHDIAPRLEDYLAQMASQPTQLRVSDNKSSSLAMLDCPQGRLSTFAISAETDPVRTVSPFEKLA